MVLLDDDGRDFKLDLPLLSQLTVHFQYHQNGQHINDNSGDNEITLMLSNQ